MKTIMHPDYWVEIPAGECIIGLSTEQREKIWEYVLQTANYHQRTSDEQAIMRDVVEKWRRREWEKVGELEVFGLDWRLARTAGLQECLPQQVIWVDRFYIARFPVTDEQFNIFNLKKVSSAKELPGMLDTPTLRAGKDGTPVRLRRCKGAAAGTSAEELCKELGVRFPTKDEWEKAARGTDGRLYPWGNEWNPNAGFFYKEKDRRYPCTNTPEVDDYAAGVSPHGLWNMLGGLTELKTDFTKGKPRISMDGWSPRDSTLEAAPLHYLAANRGGSGEWRPVALRPVLDEWPVQYWQGVELEKPQAPVLKLSPYH